MSMQLNTELFRPVTKEKAAPDQIVRPSMTYWQDAWRRLKHNRIAMIGMIVIGILVIMAIFGPMMQPYSYSEQNFMAKNQWPSAQHWFGTDNLGRDLFVRVWYGARISLFIALMAALMDLVIGVIYGAISGFKGGNTDEVMMRIVEVLFAIPYLLVVIMLMVVMGQGLWTIIIALGSLGWMNMARLVRGQMLQLKEQEYVLAARTLGASNGRLLFKHLIPNTLGVIIVNVTFTVPSAIFSEAFLSFLGLGVPVPMASWGTLASDALGTFTMGYPYQLMFPAVLISLTMLAFNLFGDGLRDALDPRMRK